MDRRGGFRKHTKSLKKEVFNRINILKTLAQKRYGARSYHLLILASSIIRSLIEYDAAVFNMACDTDFRYLEVLLALSLLKWVPNILFREYVAITSFDTRINVFSFDLWSKHLSLSNWSALWKLQDGNLVSLTGSLPYIQNFLMRLSLIPN